MALLGKPERAPPNIIAISKLTHSNTGVRRHDHHSTLNTTVTWVALAHNNNNLTPQLLHTCVRILHNYYI